MDKLIVEIIVMKNYKRIILSLFLMIGGIFFVGVNLDEIKDETIKILKATKFITVCDETLYYSLGNIDPRFNISNEEIIDILSKAEKVWEKDLNRNVFEYREGSDFKINFIFDERQQGAIEGNYLDEQLDELEIHRDNISKEYSDLEKDYNKNLAIHEGNLRDYEKKVDNFNKEVEKWNKKGGAPEDEYNKLKEEEKEIEKIRKQLVEARKDINKIISKLNDLAKTENGLVSNYNNKVETYKEKFGESREFNQGEYIGTAINIYQFYEDNDLELVLAHELGHALSIGHVENPESVMFYLMEKQDLDNIKLTSEDLAAIKNICNIK